MDPIAQALLGLLVCFVSLFVGKIWGERGSIKGAQCDERRASCLLLLQKELGHLRQEVQELKESIKLIHKRIDEALVYQQQTM